MLILPPAPSVHRRGTEFAEFGIILIENFLLRVLSASAVIFFG